MTEEENKPGGDEVTDEQLENVAGGSLTGDLADLARKGGSGFSLAPDVCKVPEPGGLTPVTCDGDKGAIKDPTKDVTDSTGGIIPDVGTNSLEDGITHV